MTQDADYGAGDRCPNAPYGGTHGLTYDSGWHCPRCPAVLHLSVWYPNEEAFRATLHRSDEGDGA